MKAEIPEHLWEMATEEQQFLLKKLPPQLLDILIRMSDKDLLVPKSCRHLESLWNDLSLLRDMQLVKQKERDVLYQFSLNLGS